VTSFHIIVRAVKQWNANRDSRMGAALAYYALFSIAPLLIIAVMIAGLLFGEDAARGRIQEHLGNMVGAEIAGTIERLVENASERSGGWAPGAGIALFLVGALGMFLHVRNTLGAIWKLEPPRGNTLLGIVWDYTLALAMVLFCGVLLIASLITSTLVRIFRPTLEDWIPGLPWDWVDIGLSFFYLTILFAAVYRILSGGRIKLRHVAYGAILGALLFTLGKTLLSYYFVYASPASIYGAAGSLVVFLIWVYYSAQILFFGAELIQARRTRHEWMGGTKANEAA
jgi:membrane protein